MEDELRDSLLALQVDILGTASGDIDPPIALALRRYAEKLATLATMGVDFDHDSPEGRINAAWRASVRPFIEPPEVLKYQRMIARSYLDSGNEWADNDTDAEALEIRAARRWCRELLNIDDNVVAS